MAIFVNAQADAASLASLVNDNGLYSTRYGDNPKKSWLYMQGEFDTLLTGFATDGNDAIDDLTVFIDAAKVDITNDVTEVDDAKTSAIANITSDLSAFDAYYQSAKDSLDDDVAAFTIDSDAALADFAQNSADAFNEFDLTLDQYKESRGFNNKGTFSAGFTYELPNDVGIDASGNPWIYNGALPFTVTAGTTPTPPTYTQVTYGTAAQVSMNTSDTVQSFADSFELKIFQSPTDGGLTEIKTRTANGSELYEVRKTSDNSLATIYSDAAGTTEIVQNGTDNKSGSDGVVKFYIEDTSADLKVEAGASSVNFKNYVFMQQNTKEQGIGVWDADTTYPVNGLAKGSNGTIYRAITEQNGNNPTGDDANWHILGEAKNIDQLRLIIPNMGNKEKIELLGHTKQGIGGGLWYVDLDDTTSNDNNGTVVVTGGVRAKRAGKRIIDVSYFGALLDGSTDDTSAVTSAIGELTNGDSLVFPHGVCGISSSGGQTRPLSGLPSGSTPTKWAIDGLNDITITGAGKIQLLGGDNFHLFNITNCKGLDLHGLSVQGNREPVLADINYDGEAGEFFRFFDCEDVRIRNNYMTLQSITCVRVGAGCKRFTVYGNINENGNDAFIQIGDASVTLQENVPVDITVYGNVITNFYTDAGIKVRYCADRVTISGNTVTSYQGAETQTAAAIMVRGGLSGVINTTNINVVGNTLRARTEDITGTGTINPVLAVPAISMFESNTLNTPVNVKINGNLCHGSINMTGDKVECTGNRVTGSIDKLNDGTRGGDVVISENKINVESTVEQKAIEITSGNFKGIIIGNDVESDKENHLITCDANIFDISNNNLVSTAGAGLGRGIVLFNATRGKIQNNAINDVKERGIYLAGSGVSPGTVLITGNNIDNTGNAGVDVSSDVTNRVRVSGNYITNFVGADYRNGGANCNMHYESNAIPTNTAQIGDTAVNTDPVAGGTEGWVYTAAGWKESGVVAG